MVKRHLDAKCDDPLFSSKMRLGAEMQTRTPKPPSTPPSPSTVPPSTTTTATTSSSTSTSTSSSSSSTSSSCGGWWRWWCWWVAAVLHLSTTSQVTHGHPHNQRGGGGGVVGGNSYDVQVRAINLPSPGVVGKPALLECDWSVGNQGFYSVRWYKDGEQFFSYVPKNDPNIKIDHNVKGLEVELSQSDKHRVKLRTLGLDSEGSYRCEVMSEAPNFKSAFAYANMTVVVLPETPQLLGLRDGGYLVGDEVNVTCSTRNSHPAARLKFYIGDSEVHPASVRVQELKPTPGSTPGVFNSHARLYLPVHEEMAPELTVRCVADVMGVVTQVVASVEVHKPTYFNIFGGHGNVTSPCLTTLLLVVLLAPALPRLLQGPYS